MAKRNFEAWICGIYRVFIENESGQPLNVEHTGQPAGARLTEAKPEEVVVALVGFERSSKL